MFGGEFDPPHIGHLAVARAARDQLELDRLLVMPAGAAAAPDALGACAAELRLRLAGPRSRASRGRR